MSRESALEIVREEMRKCMKCGNCQAVCPIYKETKTEGEVARGKIQLAEAVLKGELPVTEAFTEKMFKCLLCKTCMSKCPCGVQLDKVILAAREEIAQRKGLHPLKKGIFQVLKRQGAFDLGLKVGSKFQGLIFKKNPNGEGAVPRFPVGLDMKRVIPRIATASLKDQLPEVIPAKVSGNIKPKMRVGFFTGCTINHMFTDIGNSVVDVLTRNGVEVVIPRKQHCCGTPVFAHGDTDTAKEMAISNLRVFEEAKVDAIIIACGTCTSAWKDYFPTWLKGTQYEEKAQQYADKTYEISYFLMNKIKIDQHLGKVNTKVTYHDSCHLSRELGITKEPRELINTIPGVQFIEMKNPDRCCGGAGSFSLMFYDVSLGILEKKIEDAKSTGADYLLTGCSGCKMQLEDGVSRFGMPAKVMHPVQILDMAYRAWDKQLDENVEVISPTIKEATAAS